MLDKALVNEIGNIREKDNLLLKALLLVVTHSLQKTSRNSNVKKPVKRIIRREYNLQDAFNDAFKGKGSRLPKVSSLANTLIPKPM